MKNVLLNILVSFVSAFVAFIIFECVAQIYVYKIAEKGKLFEPDQLLGWTVKPNLDMQRKNADGDVWIVKTDKDGFRKINSQGSGTKVLILGDSFAFGEGVNVLGRFDGALVKHGYSVLNTGVMGYGTDQQYLKAKPYFDQLNKNDVVILLTYYNDFYDMSRKEHSGRAKPWFTIENGMLQLHRPEITFKEKLRDKSYIYAKIASLMDKHQDFSTTDIAHASNIYKSIVQDLSLLLKNKGVRFLIAYHGIPIVNNVEHKKMIEGTINTICANTQIDCMNIDKYLKNKRLFFLSDGHWSKKGHEIVGSLLYERLSRSF